MISAIVLQHAEEAAFAWALRDYAFRTPHHDFTALSRFDERCEGHLDGLRVGGDEGWSAVTEELGWHGASEVFVGSVLAAESDDSARFEHMLAIATERPEVARGTSSALGWIEDAQAKRWIAKLGVSSHPLERRIAVAATAIRRLDPGPALSLWIADDDPQVRARALRAVGEIGRKDLLPRVLASMSDEDQHCAFWASTSAVLLGNAAGLAPLCKHATDGGPFAERAADMAARGMDADKATAWRQELAKQQKHLRLAIRVAGAYGDPVCVPWLIDLMTIRELARVSGEAFASITGVDLVYSGLSTKRPEGLDVSPNDDPANANVALDADEDLPFPAVGSVGDWWDRQQELFPSGARYLLGAPISQESSRRALSRGKQRQRCAAAIELAIAQPGSVLFEIRERADRQVRRLQK